MKTGYQAKPTQEERILAFLEERGAEGVHSWEIVQMPILQYTARIWGLRDKGYDIVNVKKNLYVLGEYVEEYKRKNESKTK